MIAAIFFTLTPFCYCGYSKTKQNKHNKQKTFVSLLQPLLINLFVSGVFREPSPSTSVKSWPVRHFSRAFLIVPVGQGFCIINDTLFITNATEDQVRVHTNIVCCCFLLMFSRFFNIVFVFVVHFSVRLSKNLKTRAFFNLLHRIVKSIKPWPI